MEIQLSYPVRIEKLSDEQKHILQQTTSIYREATNYMAEYINKEWLTLQQIENQQDRYNAAERLFHATRTNPKPKYPEFDLWFPKLPSYYRRAAVRATVGHVSSYQSNHENWITDGKPGAEPQLGCAHPSPAFYDSNMFLWDSEYPLTAQLKVFKDNDWNWINIKLRQTDVKYIKKHCWCMERSAPILQKKGKSWSLRFTFTMETQLTEKPETNRRVLAVDLGVNNAATMCVMEPDGTVIARRFVKFASEEDHLRHELNRMRKRQPLGTRDLKKKWGFINNLNTELSRKTATAIIDMGIEYSCDVVVMEYLDMTGKVRGSRVQRLRVWRYREVQKLVELHAHRWGMRFSRVCAWGTSRLAFDGSGRVKRGREIEPRSGEVFGYGTVEFSNGKLFAADLNAAYNIGARYFVRALLKPLPVTVRSFLAANVPSGLSGSTSTLRSLIDLNVALGRFSCLGREWRSCGFACVASSCSAPS